MILSPLFLGPIRIEWSTAPGMVVPWPSHGSGCGVGVRNFCGLGRWRARIDNRLSGHEMVKTYWNSRVVLVTHKTSVLILDRQCAPIVQV